MPDHSPALLRTPSDDAVVEATKNWLQKAVIGLNLCPFAKAVDRKNQIRYVVSAATDRDVLASDLAAELSWLHASAPDVIDTTLLIHPHVLGDFFDYNGFLPEANRIVKRLGLTGKIQIATFHPHYEFADCPSDAIENYTNRAPYQMLHLLRESSIERAVTAFPDAADIYKNNIETMRALGEDGWQAIWSSSVRS